MTFAHLTRESLSAVVVAAVTLAYGFSFGALLFPGALEAGVGRGVSMVLLGAGLSGFVIAWRTSLRPAVGGPDTPVLAAISALSLGVVLPQLQAGLPGELAIDRVAALVLVASLAVGLGLLALGLARVGSALRFIPFPVVAGFIAGSGLYLLLGALRLLLQQPLELSALQQLLAPERLAQLAAALFLPAVLFGLRPFWRPFYLLPLLFFAETAVLHLVLALTGPETPGAGWFLAAGAGRLTPPWTLMQALDWHSLLAVGPELAAVVVVAATSLLMNASGLEVAWRRSADLDRELVTGGSAGLLCGVAGGAISSLSLNRSLLNAEAGGRSRLSGLIAAGVLLLCGLSGVDLAGLVPLPVLAGLLFYVGLSMLLARLRELPPRQGWADYLLMLLIMLLIVAYGYLEGVFAGIVGACLFFAFNYSRVGIVKHVLTRRERASDVERPLPQKQLLEEHGERVRMVDLQGYIFFGTSNGLLDRLRALYGKVRHEGPQLLILDFRMVTGIDSSAVISFLRLAHFCEEWSIQLVFAGLAPAQERVIESRGDPALAGARRFRSLAEALEHAEETLLTWSGSAAEVAGSLERWFQRDSQGLGEQPVERLLDFLERRTVAAGETIFSQGEPSDSIELLLSGRVQVVLDLPDGSRLRLRTMLEQTVLGEMGFFRRLPRSATVVAEQPSLLYRVTRARYERMLAEAPEAAAALHRVIIATLSDRIAFANSEVAALKR